MRSKKLTVWLMALSMMLVLSGCGSNMAKSDMAMTESMSAQSAPQIEAGAEIFYDNVMYEEKANEEPAVEAEKVNESAAAMQERKLIKTVDMNVETKEFDAAMAAVEEKVTELGGYIENMETYNGSSYSGYRSSRNANMTVRIPRQHLETFLDTVAGISNVVRRSESVEDVTLTYVDLESHKKVLQAEQETLIELMKKAEAIEDIITIESRLSEVRYQIESMESQLRTFDNKVNYSTVYLYVEEVKELTPIVEETVLERIGNGFIDSVEEIRDGLTEFAVWFVVNIPYFILWILVLIVVILVCKVFIKVLQGRNDRWKDKEISRGKREEEEKNRK